MRMYKALSQVPSTLLGPVLRKSLLYLAGEEGFEPSHAGIKIQCLNQLGDSPTRVDGQKPPTDNLKLLPTLPKDEPRGCCTA